MFLVVLFRSSFSQLPRPSVDRPLASFPGSDQISTCTVSMNYSASDFRDSHAQEEYRRQSKCANKDDKDVGHILSLEIAAEVLNNYREPGGVPDNELDAARKFLNDFANFRMVSRVTNTRERIM